MESRAEMKINKILSTQTDWHYEREYSFKDLISSTGVPLRFDFVIFTDDGDIDFIIEYQGKQHYMPVTKFGGRSAFYTQQMHDRQKRNYCQQFGYKLIEIPYTDEHKITYDYIMERAGYVD